MGSPYVPLDSWIYPALERLAALGYVRSNSLDMRPWTRLECARLLNEAAENLSDADAAADVENLYRQLSDEFAYEFQLMSGDSNVHAQVESTYARTLGISGKPLTDNEHFGQTLVNDYGRPFQEGFNSVVGASAWTAAGPFVMYVNGEFQSAPSAPAPSAAALNFISSADNLPPNAPLTPLASIDRFRLLDAYVAMTFANWQISFGRRGRGDAPHQQRRTSQQDVPHQPRQSASLARRIGPSRRYPHGMVPGPDFGLSVHEQRAKWIGRNYRTIRSHFE
jgi:hypothetical protein